jgi:hypothetical protein
MENMTNTILQKSADFLKSVLMRQKDLFDFLSYFEKIEKQQLVELLNEEKLVFWINLYNSFVQIELQNSGTQKIYTSMFTEELFTLAGEFMSLDMIEHGILRGNKWKYGLGFIPGGHLPGRIRHWKCKTPESRIHYLLNCGAASCPVIRVLDEKNLGQELEMAERDFILQEVNIDKATKTVHIPGLMLYYYSDFGGKKGIRQTIEKYKQTKGMKLKFGRFDWSLEPFKIKEEL